MGLCGFHSLSPLDSSPLAQGRGSGEWLRSTWAKGSWGSREKPLPQDLQCNAQNHPAHHFSIPRVGVVCTQALGLQTLS